MNTDKRPSEIVRDALRAWVRQCVLWDRTDKSQDPGRLSKLELAALITRLGGDPAAITAAALGQAPTPTEDKPPMPLDATPAPALDVQAQVEALKSDLVEGGFSAVRQRLADLITAAAKPAEVKIITKTEYLPAPVVLAAGVHDLKPAYASTWSKLFGVKADKPITVWDHPSCPTSNPTYVFPEAETTLALSQMARSEAARLKGAPAKHVLLFGPAGTGKSAWVKEFAARTGRPFTVLALNDGCEMDVLIGQSVLDGKGGTKWQDGLLLAAMRQPGMVICLDEVGGMRPAVGVALNGLLQDMVYYVPDTGERVPVARGVVFVATNNANLMDGGAAKGYVGIQRQNRAFADRFGVSIEVGYAPAATEEALLVSYTACTPQLAKLLVDVATLSRAKAATDDLTHGIGFRRLLAWAECLMDGVPADAAFAACVLNTAPEGDNETLRQLALVALDPAAIKTAVKGQTPKPVGRGGADFTDVGTDLLGGTR